jgi:hypothetical protein
MYCNNYSAVGNSPFQCEGELFIRTLVPADKYLFLPTDLVELPEPTWDAYPNDSPISAEEARTLLWTFSGNVSQAAAYYKIPPARLRAFVRSSTYIARELAEIQERLLDLAEHNLCEALMSDDPKRNNWAAKFILERTAEGRSRMFVENPVQVKNVKSKRIVTWLTQK